MNLGDLDRLIVGLGWVCAYDDDGEAMWARAEDHRTSVIHAVQHQTGVRARVVVRERLPMRVEHAGQERVRQPAALRGTMTGERLADLLREGL